MARKEGKRPGFDPLESALDAWRQAEAGAAPAERLSETAREAVIARAHQARSEVDAAPLARLFVPVARIVYAATVPVLALVLTLGWWGSRPDAVHGPGNNGVAVFGTKVDGQAVFRIANGGRTHRVFRSTSPIPNSGEKLLATTDDSFRDGLSGAAGVVYYRID